MPIFKKPQTNHKTMPEHIGIIMDGNGRWARRRALPRSAGHAAGGKTFKKIARYANKIGLHYMTVYAFSTENWKRAQEEVDGIMDLLRDYLKDTDRFKDENIRLRFIGDTTALPADIQDLIAKSEDDSKNATGMVLNIAMNYGGRDEIVHATRNLAKKCMSGGIRPDDITERMLSEHLYTAGQPDPDFIIRPSGEERLSNFLVWQSAYSEFWFSDVLWPDFSEKHLDAAIADYAKRNRRFGG